MAKKPANNTAAKKVVELLDLAELEPAKLKSYIWHDAGKGSFTFGRYWWEGCGPREGITPWVRRKLRPGDDPDFGWAAKAEVLLPPTAPGDYANLDFLLDRFDETLPPFERHTMVQAKIALDPDEPWHAAYERVRAYARSHFAVRFPVVLVAHVPGVAGLDGFGSHVHCVALSRPVGINGFGGACHVMCSDRGYATALAAWRAHVAAEEARA